MLAPRWLPTPSRRKRRRSEAKDPRVPRPSIPDSHGDGAAVNQMRLRAQERRWEQSGGHHYRESKVGPLHPHVIQEEVLSAHGGNVGGGSDIGPFALTPQHVASA